MLEGFQCVHSVVANLLSAEPLNLSVIAPSQFKRDTVSLPVWEF